MKDPDLLDEDFFDNFEDDFNKIIVEPLLLDGQLRSSDGLDLDEIQDTDGFDWR